MCVFQNEYDKPTRASTLREEHFIKKRLDHHDEEKPDKELEQAIIKWEAKTLWSRNSSR
jgi:hypothetical protein